MRTVYDWCAVHITGCCYWWCWWWWCWCWCCWLWWRSAVERLPTQLGADRVRRNQRHPYYAGESLETGHRALQQVSQPLTYLLTYLLTYILQRELVQLQLDQVINLCMKSDRISWITIHQSPAYWRLNCIVTHRTHPAAFWVWLSSKIRK